MNLSSRPFENNDHLWKVLLAGRNCYASFVRKVSSSQPTVNRLQATRSRTTVAPCLSGNRVKRPAGPLSSLNEQFRTVHSFCPTGQEGLSVHVENRCPQLNYRMKKHPSTVFPVPTSWFPCEIGWHYWRMEGNSIRCRALRKRWQPFGTACVGGHGFPCRYRSSHHFTVLKCFV